MNLVSNAAKFTEAGRIDLTLSILGSSLAIAVSNTGFSRVEDVKTEHHQGAGLGLVLSRNLVELIGGTISITSTHGKGTAAVVSLPLQITENQRELYNAD
jgi:signal transduction histidine kinase